MNQPDAVSAAMMRNGATGLAGYAASELFESHPDLHAALSGSAGSRLGEATCGSRYPDLQASQTVGAFATWQSVLRNCVEELAASLAAGEPRFFTGYLSWLQSALTARGLPSGALPAALKSLAKVLARELPPESGARAAGVCEQALGALRVEVPETPSWLNLDTSHGRLAASYLLALLEGERARASSLILEAAQSGASVPQLYLEVLLPAQQELGRMWQADEINVAEEHFATSTTKAIIAQLRLRASMRQRNGKTLLAAAVAGNQHEIGLQIVADLFEMEGWRVIQLGPDMPIPDLAEAVEFYQPDLLALSVSRPPQLVTLTETIQAVRRGQRGADVKILVGGRALAEAANLAQQFGADGYAADANAAVALGNSLVGLAGPAPVAPTK